MFSFPARAAAGALSWPLAVWSLAAGAGAVWLAGRLWRRGLLRYCGAGG